MKALCPLVPPGEKRSDDKCLGKCDKCFPLNLRHCVTVSPEHFLLIVNLYQWVCWHINCCLYDINSYLVLLAATFMIRFAAISTLHTSLLWKTEPREFPAFCVRDENLKNFTYSKRKQNSVCFHSDMFRSFLWYKQRDALISEIYFRNRTLHVSDSFSVHHQESSSVHTAC
jgi:hypothetical protein